MTIHVLITEDVIVLDSIPSIVYVTPIGVQVVVMNLTHSLTHYVYGETVPFSSRWLEPLESFGLPVRQSVASVTSLEREPATGHDQRSMARNVSEGPPIGNVVTKTVPVSLVRHLGYGWAERVAAGLPPGGWNLWSLWTQCTKSCGIGLKERRRICIPAQNGGRPCSGFSTNKQQCCESDYTTTTTYSNFWFDYDLFVS